MCSSDLFIAGGENIQPETIEAALRAIPGVAAAAVVPAPDAEYGQIPVAFIQWREGTTPDLEHLKTALRATLPGYMIPKRIHPWPKEEQCTLSGKIDRATLCELAQTLQKET